MLYVDYFNLPTEYFRISVNRESKYMIFSFVSPNFRSYCFLLIIKPGICKPGQTIAKFNTTYCNIAGHNMWRAFGHSVTKCCDMLGVTNRTSMHRLSQRCYALAKRLYNIMQHRKCCIKIGQFTNLIQQRPTCRNTQAIAYNISTQHIAI